MKFPIKFLAAVCAVIIGIVGLIIFLVPHYGVEKVVYDYIDAAQNGDTKKMQSYQMSSQLGGLVSDSISASAEDVLRGQILGLPEDAGKVVSVEILGCTKEKVDFMGTKAYDVTALIQAVYKDAEGAEQTIIVERSFGVMKANDGYKIIQ